MGIYGGVNNLSKKVTSIYAGVNGVAVPVKTVYAGVDGKAVKVWGGGPKPVRIYVATSPKRTLYAIGETLDLSGMVIKAVWSNGEEADITSEITTSPRSGAALSADNRAITISWTYNENTFSASQVIMVEDATGVIYGAEWDGTATTKWTRTDDAAGFADPNPAVNNGTGSSPFDSIMPWAGMVKSERTGGTMVAIPKFYYTLTKNGDAMKIRISPKYFAGASISPAHRDRGDGAGERDIVYAGRYLCAETTYKSTTGVNKAAVPGDSRDYGYIHNLGDNIWLCDYMTRITIWLLYLVEYADWNSQATIGYGCGSGLTGQTDAMQYHTGTSAANRTTYGPTQYRNIEGLWDIGKEHIGLIKKSGTNIYAGTDPSKWTIGESESVLVGTVPTTSHWIKAWSISDVSGYDWFIYPSYSSGGSGDTYICDYYNYGNTGSTFHTQATSQAKYRGLFEFSSAYSSGSNTARIMELP